MATRRLKGIVKTYLIYKDNDLVGIFECNKQDRETLVKAFFDLLEAEGYIIESQND